MSPRMERRRGSRRRVDRAAARAEVVWTPGMSQEEAVLRIGDARWRHGGRAGARSRLELEVLDGLRTTTEVDVRMAELDRRAEDVKGRIAALAAARVAGTARPRATGAAPRARRGKVGGRAGAR